MDNCWISCQVMADMKKFYDDLIIINLYILRMYELAHSKVDFLFQNIFWGPFFTQNTNKLCHFSPTHVKLDLILNILTSFVHGFWTLLSPWSVSMIGVKKTKTQYILGQKAFIFLCCGTFISFLAGLVWDRNLVCCACRLASVRLWKFKDGGS